MLYPVVPSAHAGLPAIRLCVANPHMLAELTAPDEDRVVLGSGRNDLTLQLPVAAYLSLAGSAAEAFQFASSRRCETFLVGNPEYGVMIRVVYRFVDITRAGSDGRARLTHAEFLALGHQPLVTIGIARLAHETVRDLPTRQRAA